MEALLSVVLLRNKSSLKWNDKTALYFEVSQARIQYVKLVKLRKKADL